MMSAFDSLVDHVRVPRLGDKIFKDECIFYFDSPDFENGVYICLKNFYSISFKMLRFYHENTGCRAFLHYTVKKQFKHNVKATEPTKLGIGIEGGFDNLCDRYDITEHWKLFRLPEGDTLNIPTFPPDHLPSDTSHLNSLNLPPVLAASIAAIQCSKSTLLMEENESGLSAWEDDNVCFISSYALDLVQLNNNVHIPPSGWKCARCDLKENLWLNLTDGSILCGRKFWDGTGGNNHALQHYETTKYPLAVKLGTITPKGGDVYSYAEDSMVTDPKLAEHLSHFGIDIMLMKKTDKTLAELEISANERLGEWLTIQESNSKLEPRYGPGMTGLLNLGNTCYMNSVIQVLFALPYFRWYYAYDLLSWCRRAIDRSKDANQLQLPTDDVGLQFAKLGNAMCSGVRSWLTPENFYQITKGPVPSLPGIRPLIFRRLMGLHSRTFSSKHQQDAAEFLTYLLELLDKEANLNAVVRVSNVHGQTREISTPTFPFRLAIEDRMECGLTHKVCYSSHNELILALPIPLDAMQNKDEVSNFEERCMEAERSGFCLTPEEIVRPRIPFEACLSNWAQSERIDNFRSPASQPVGQNTHAIRSSHLLNYPDYLCVQVGRFAIGPDWLPRKLDIELEFGDTSSASGDPMNFRIDLGSFKKVAGLQTGEQPMPVVDEAHPSGSESANEELNSAIVDELMMMGFGLEACKKACKHTNNASLELATNWLMEHFDDPTLNEPESTKNAPVSGSAGLDENSIEILMGMGFSRTQAVVSLTHANNSVEAAADWAFGNPDELESAVTDFNGAASKNDVSMASEFAADDNSNTVHDLKNQLTDGKSSVYELFAFVSHMGKSTNDGHYVAHIKRSFLAKSLPNDPPVYHSGSPICSGSDHEWIIFNDEKVARSESPPYRHGYLYFFRRLDAPTD